MQKSGELLSRAFVVGIKIKWFGIEIDMGIATNQGNDNGEFPI